MGALALLVSGAESGCTSSSKSSSAKVCLLDSDCSGTLVCRLGLCHAECAKSKDCKNGGRCVRAGTGSEAGLADTSPGVCLLAVESICSSKEACTEPLICAADLQCRSTCTTAADCLAEQVCAEGGVCADPNEVDSSGRLLDAPKVDAGTGAGGANGGSGGAGGVDASRLDAGTDAGPASPCAGSPCLNGGTCSADGGITCTCAAGFFGPRCGTECAPEAAGPPAADEVNLVRGAALFMSSVRQDDASLPGCDGACLSRYAADGIRCSDGVLAPLAEVATATAGELFRADWSATGAGRIRPRRDLPARPRRDRGRRLSLG